MNAMKVPLASHGSPMYEETVRKLDATTSMFQWLVRKLEKQNQKYGSEISLPLEY